MMTSSFNQSLPSVTGVFSNTPYAKNVPKADVYTDLSSLESLKHNQDKDASLKAVAKQFESLFFNMMLKNMRKANEAFEKDSLFNSNESKTYRDMYDNQLALSLASGKGVGIAEVMYRQLKGDHHSIRDAKQIQGLEQSPSTIKDVNDKSVKNEDAKTVTAENEGVQNIANLSRDSFIHAMNKLPQQAEGRSVENGKNNPSNIQNRSITTNDSINFDAKTPREFVEKLYPIAKAAADRIGLNPLVMIAQSALETGWGKHMVRDASGQSSNNFFNIKADARWGGDAVRQSTLEFNAGVPEQQMASFRRYDGVHESFQDFIDFITSNSRYDSAIQASGDEQDFISALHAAGYATDPQYSEKILRIFRQIQPQQATLAQAKENSSAGIN